jgi:hypothetical protein
VLGAFFDDSGTHSTSLVVAMGGLVGTEPQWDAFERRWLALLKEPLPDKPPLEQFHLAPCRNGQGEFIGYSQAERDHVTYRFRQVILETGFVTVAVAADTAVWNELVVGDLADELGTALQFCFFKCVETVSQVIRFSRPGEPIDMYFDKGTESHLEVLAEMFRQLKGNFPEIENLAFAPVKQCIALQGADMIAYETFLYGQECLRKPDNPVANAHFQEYVRRPLSTGLFARREHIEQFVSRARKTIARREQG